MLRIRMCVDNRMDLGATLERHRRVPSPSAAGQDCQREYFAGPCWLRSDLDLVCVGQCEHGSAAYWHPHSSCLSWYPTRVWSSISKLRMRRNKFYSIRTMRVCLTYPKEIIRIMERRESGAGLLWHPEESVEFSFIIQRFLTYCHILSCFFFFFEALCIQSRLLSSFRLYSYSYLPEAVLLLPSHVH